MNYIFNKSTQTYKNLTAYASSIAEPGDNLVVLLTDLDAIFNIAKRRTAMRGRFATDGKGDSMLEKLSLTDDERDWYDEIMKVGGPEIFRKMQAWTKGIDSAYRHNVKFGNPIVAGQITSATTTELTFPALNPALVVNALANKKIIITTPGPNMNQERTILSNTATTITVSVAFPAAPVLADEWVTFPITGNFIIQYLKLDASWDLNIFIGLGAAIEEALTLYAVKEWYKINRNTNDFPIEEAEYERQMQKVKSQLLSYKVPARRVTDMFQ